MKRDWRGTAIQLGIPPWLIRRLAPDYLDLLLEAQLQNKLDEVTERRVKRVLFQLRAKQAVAPYLAIFTLGWEIICGKYWKSRKEVYGGPDPTSGACAGTGSIPTAQYSYAPGTVNPANPSAVYAGAITGVNIPAPPDVPDAGIKAGEVRGYRCWKLGADGLLYSVIYSDFVWKPGEVAEGDPDKDAESGIYAFKSILLLHNYGNPDAHSVTGTVDLWGQVYEHRNGYRAQYAAISSIDDSPYYDAKAIRKRYGLTKRPRKKK